MGQPVRERQSCKLLTAPGRLPGPARPLPARAAEAFTLVELLVVIAILALLVSMLMPMLSRAKELTRAVMCLTNVKGVNTALAMYSTQASGKMPSTRGWGADQGWTYIGWVKSLTRHHFLDEPDGTQQRDILYCPDKALLIGDATVRYWPHAESHYAHSALGGDGTGGGGSWQTWPSPWDNPRVRFNRYRNGEWGPYTIEEVVRPGRIVRVGEGAWFWQIPYKRYICTDYLAVNGKGSPGVFYSTPQDVIDLPY